MTTSPPRPRLLYCAAFAWLSVTGGRFLAPFLEHEALFSDTMVGSVLALQSAVSSLLGSAGGSYADTRERRYPTRGRAQVMLCGVAMGFTAFALHGAAHVVPAGWSFLMSPEWHFGLRIVWAFSSSLVLPVLDGMTLAHLEKTPHMSREDYGKERLFGAISWALTNVVLGPIIDVFGFVVLYPFAALVTVLSFVSIAVYVKGQQEAFQLPAATTTDDKLPLKQNKEPIQPAATTTDDSLPLKQSSLEPSIQPKIPLSSLFWILTGSVYGAAFMFALVCLCMGTSVVENLVFIFFEFLGGSNTMCGMTVALTVLFEIPIFQLAPCLLQRVGSGALLLVAGCSYIVRIVGYTLVPKGHTWFVLLLEPLHGVTYACSQTSSVEFVAQRTPKGSEASGQGLLGVFKGMGSVVGLFLGGFLEERLGPRVMYRILASIVAVGMTVFGVSSSWCCCWKSRHVAFVRPHHHTDSNLVEPDDDDVDNLRLCSVELVPSNKQ